jgi:hypothetical protein
MTNTLYHPSGLTWERWHWPFKTDAERAAIAKWRTNPDPYAVVFDTSIPF